MQGLINKFETELEIRNFFKNNLNKIVKLIIYKR